MAFLGLETLAQKGIFAFYTSIWISFGLLNQHVKSAGIQFNSATAVLLQCLLKILLSCGLYVRQDGTRRELLGKVAEHRRVFLLYAIPASLYAVYDVLSYVNLRHLDPPTYFLLMNGRLALTGLVHQFIFAKRLERSQWVALAIIMAGCVVKTAGDNATTAVENRVSVSVYGLVFVQILASQVANVYNELLLKKQSAVPLHLQNLFLYLNSVVALLLILASGVTGQSLGEALRGENLRVMLHPAIFAMVLTMSVAGLAAGAFLKMLDSVRKAIASALELVILPLFTAALFHIGITLHLVCAVAMVSSGVYLYSIPAGVPATATTTETSADGDGDNDEVDVERQALVNRRKLTSPQKKSLSASSS